MQGRSLHAARPCLLEFRNVSDFLTQSDSGRLGPSSARVTGDRVTGRHAVLVNLL